MATLTIRQLDDQVYDSLKARAKSNHRSVEAEVRHLLGERLHSRGDWIAELSEFHSAIVTKHGYMPDSVATIREIRDAE